MDATETLSSLSSQTRRPPRSLAEIYQRVLALLSEQAAPEQLDQRLTELLELCAAGANVRSAFLYLFEPNGQTLRLRAATGCFQQHKGSSVGIGHGVAGRVVAYNDLVVVADYERWAGNRVDVSMEGVLSLMAVPIRRADELLGVIGLASSTRQAAFAPSHAPWLSSLGQAAVLLCSAAGMAQASVAVRRVLTDAIPSDWSWLRRHPGIAMLKDGENRVLAASEAFAALLGLPVEAIEGQYLWELDPENAARFYLDDLAALDSEAILAPVTMRWSGVDGRARWLELDRIPDRRSGERVLLVLGHETSERRNLIEQGQASLRAAERANRVKSHYFRAIAHEVREPMHELVGLAQRLAEAELPATQSPRAQALAVRAESIYGTLCDLVDFARVDSAQLDVELAPVELPALLADVLDSMAASAQARGILLSGGVCSDSPARVGADFDRLRHVLVLALANAFKCVRDTHLRVELSVRERAEQGALLHMTFADAAGQLGESVFATLAEAASSWDEETILSRGLREIGLAILHRQVLLLGGEFVHGTTGSGLRGIACNLPARWIEDAPPAVEPIVARALIAAQSKPLRELLCAQVGALGLHVEEADSLAGTERLLREAREQNWVHDLALVAADLGEAGIALGRRLAHARIPAIQLSAFGTPAHDVFHDRLQLPLHDHRLRAAVEAALAGQTARREGEPASSLRSEIIYVDSPDPRWRSTELALRRLGCELHRPAPQRAAIEHALARAPSAIVVIDCDVARRELGEWLEAVRAAEAGRTRRPILCLGSSEADREFALANGADAFLHKPARPRQLFEQLRRWSR